MPDLLVYAAVAVLMFPAALLGHWIGYNGLRWLDCKLTGRPSEAEVQRRLLQIELDRAEWRGRIRG